MHRLFAALALAAIAAPAPAAPVPAAFDFAQARVASKKQAKPLVLLADTSGAAPDSEAVRRAFAASPGPAGAITAVHDYADRGADKPKGPDPMPWNLPALMILDADGRLFSSAEGLRAANVGAALAAIGPQLELLRRRDALLVSAKKEKGPARARLVGNALDLMPYTAAVARKDLVAELKRDDPDDTTGYVFRYTFDAAEWQERFVGKAIADKTADTALATVATLLAKPGLSVAHRQLLLAGRYRLLNETGKRAEALATLRTIISTGPGTDMARGASGYLALLTEPVRLSALAWRRADNRPQFTPMIADVSAIVKEPGDYDIEFRNTSGHTRFRKIALISGTAVIVADDNPKERRKVRLRVTQRPSGTVTLSAESLGTGWFDGAGDILVTKAN